MNLRLTTLLGAALVLAGCGSYAGGGGGGGPKNVGGPVGGNCNLEYHNQGCAPGTSPAQKVQCQDKDGTASWVDAGSCTANQYCLEETDPNDAQGIKKIATCKDTPTTGGGVDTVGGVDGTSGGSDATGDAGTGGGKTPAEEYACIEKACPTQVAACNANPKCAGLITCAKACKDESCRDNCGKAIGEDRAVFGLLFAMTTCGTEKKCLEAEVTSPVCGDGKCDEGETAASCAKDCGKTGPVCGNESCEEGETPSTCPQDCKPAAKCGNEKCEAGESYTTCPTDCQCKADSECGEGKKCNDGVCMTSGGGGTAVCGNFKCESGESKTSCAIDCDPEISTALACAEQKCSSDFAKCKSSKTCVDALVCMTKCADESCLINCATKAPNDIGTLQTLGECVNKNCSGDTTGPVCGDGKCESPETASTCPKDCQPGGCTSDANCKSGETCQDGKCVAGGGGTNSCVGKCGKYEAGWTCQCDSACSDPANNDCCPDLKTVCAP